MGKDNTIHGLYEENNSECWLPSSFDMDNLMILIYQEGHITRILSYQAVACQMQMSTQQRRHDLAWSHWTNPPWEETQNPPRRGGLNGMEGPHVKQESLTH